MFRYLPISISHNTILHIYQHLRTCLSVAHTGYPLLGPIRNRKQAIALLYLWKDLFVEDVKDLPETDLVCLTIPTYPGARPYRSKDPIYAADEIPW